jgi:hypothetical protein
MTFEETKTAIPEQCINDFLTAVRSPPVKHKQFSLLPSKSSLDIYPMNTFIDSPTMTRGLALKFCNKITEYQFVTSIGSDCIVRHKNGTVLQNTDGVLVGAMCSQSLPQNVQSELLVIYCQMEIHRQFLMRGKEVANVCANFIVTGYKEDLNTKLKMTHSPKDDKSAISDMEMRGKLRSIFKKHIYPIVKYEFSWLFELVKSWLHEHNVGANDKTIAGIPKICHTKTAFNTLDRAMRFVRAKKLTSSSVILILIFGLGFVFNE